MEDGVGKFKYDVVREIEWLQGGEGRERILVYEIDVIVSQVQELDAGIAGQGVCVQLLQLVVAEVQDLQSIVKTMLLLYS